MRYITRYNSKFAPVKPEHVGEERELVDRRGKVRYIAKIIKVTRDKVTYRKVA